MKKKINKLFLLIGTTVVPITTIVTTSVSCTTKRQRQSWKYFKKETAAESAFNIVKATKTPTWSDAKASELKKTDYTVDDENLEVTLTIVRTMSDGLAYETNFKITYKSGTEYNVNNWKYIDPPTVLNQKNWATFKYFASLVSASGLLAQIKKLNLLDSFKWTYGTPSQVRWSINDKAEFDTYGALTNHDESGFKGMSGKPVSDYKHKTITAIISRVGREGLYDADPILAKATYIDGDSYDISKWKFSKTTQRQSIEKGEKMLLAEFNVAKSLSHSADFGKFGLENWATLGKDTAAVNHSHSNYIVDVLERQKDSKGKYKYPQVRAINFWNSKIHDPYEHHGIPLGFQGFVSIEFNVGSPTFNTFFIFLYFRFIFSNKYDSLGGVNAFNNTFTSSVELKPNKKI